MKNLKTLLGLVLVLAMVISVGCSSKKETPDNTTGFSYSESILESGYWENVKALDYVKLCEYKGISTPSNLYEISDESLQKEIDNILAEYATDKQIKDRAVKDGDTVNMDYVGKVDGVAFENGSTGGSGTDVTIGVTPYIDDFLEQLIGHKPGESFDIEVTFPKDYGVENLNGKDAVFAITMNYIVEKTTPELTDDFVKEKLSSNYGWNTVTMMKEDMKSKMQSTALANHLQEYVIKNTTVTSIPDTLMKYQENSVINNCQKYAESSGISLEQYLNSNFGVSSTEELLKEYLDKNKEMATVFLINQAIAEDIGISVTDDDVGNYFKEKMKKDDYSDYKETYGMPYLKLNVLNDKVMNYLKDNAVKG